jgi:undecaprenyl-diphosphatase
LELLPAGRQEFGILIRRIQITIIQSIFLGIVQGLTEFLPVSSSGHLVFFQSLFGLKEPPIFFDVMLHLGTLLAVVVYFWKDIWTIIKGILSILERKEENREGAKLFLLIILATIPTGLMGIFLKDWFESFFSQARSVGVMLILTGLLLWMTRLAKKEGRPLEKMRWIDSILIGIAQGVAIIPGISRSGSTISTGLFCGLDRELCARFSFLLSIPAILGATILEIKKMDSGGGLWTTLIGSAIAFGVGILALTLLIKVIKMGKIFNFSYYCWGMGILMIILQ